MLIKAKGSLEPSIYFTGEKIEKLDEDTYRLTDGVITSCDIEDPDCVEIACVGQNVRTVQCWALS